VEQPAGSPPQEDRPGPPTNEAEYVTAARVWIKKQTASHEDARAYFEGDHHVITAPHLRVSIGTRNLLRRELAANTRSRPNEKTLGKGSPKEPLSVTIGNLELAVEQRGQTLLRSDDGARRSRSAL